MQKILVLIVCFALAVSVFAQNQAARIFPADAKIEVLYDGGTHTEGVAVAPDGTIYFCDAKPTSQPGKLSTGAILRWDERRKQAVVAIPNAGQPNGLKIDAQGRFIIAEGADGGGRRITRIDPQTGESEILAQRYREKLLNSPNDLIFGVNGRIYFTDPRYDGKESIEQPVQGVYLINEQNEIKLVIADAKPNGLAISPDGKTLYIAHHENGSFAQGATPPDVALKREMQIRAYDLTADGAARFRRVVVDFGAEAGADGIAVDRDGNIFAAVRETKRRGIRVYAPDGAEIAYLATPELPTNLVFGRGRGDEKNLYITAGGSLYRVKTNQTGVQ